MEASANIEITRIKGKLHSVSIVMPIWTKLGSDNVLEVHIPLLGLKTFAKNENDVFVAVGEATTLFCKSCENFGRGLETELKSLKWINVTDSTSLLGFKISQNNSVVNQMMETGDNFAQTLRIAC